MANLPPRPPTPYWAMSQAQAQVPNSPAVSANEAEAGSEPDHEHLSDEEDMSGEDEQDESEDADENTTAGNATASNTTARNTLDQILADINTTTDQVLNALTNPSASTPFGFPTGMSIIGSTAPANNTSPVPSQAAYNPLASTNPDNIATRPPTNTPPIMTTSDSPLLAGFKNILQEFARKQTREIAALRDEVIAVDARVATANRSRSEDLKQMVAIVSSLVTHIDGKAAQAIAEIRSDVHNVNERISIVGEEVNTDVQEVKTAFDAQAVEMQKIGKQLTGHIGDMDYRLESLKTYIHNGTADRIEKNVGAQLVAAVGGLERSFDGKLAGAMHHLDAHFTREIKDIISRADLNASAADVKKHVTYELLRTTGNIENSVGEKLSTTASGLEEDLDAISTRFTTELGKVGHRVDVVHTEMLAVADRHDTTLARTVVDLNDSIAKQQEEVKTVVETEAATIRDELALASIDQLEGTLEEIRNDISALPGNTKDEIQDVSTELDGKLSNDMGSIAIRHEETKMNSGALSQKVKDGEGGLGSLDRGLVTANDLLTSRHEEVKTLVSNEAGRLRGAIAELGLTVELPADLMAKLEATLKNLHKDIVAHPHLFGTVHVSGPDAIRNEMATMRAQIADLAQSVALDKMQNHVLDTLNAVSGDLHEKIEATQQSIAELKDAQDILEIQELKDAQNKLASKQVNDISDLTQRVEEFSANLGAISGKEYGVAMGRLDNVMAIIREKMRLGAGLSDAALNEIINKVTQQVTQHISDMCKNINSLLATTLNKQTEAITDAISETNKDIVKFSSLLDAKFARLNQSDAETNGAREARMQALVEKITTNITSAIKATVPSNDKLELQLADVATQVDEVFSYVTEMDGVLLQRDDNWNVTSAPVHEQIETLVEKVEEISDKLGNELVIELDKAQESRVLVQKIGVIERLHSLQDDVNNLKFDTHKHWNTIEDKFIEQSRVVDKILSEMAKWTDSDDDKSESNADSLADPSLVDSVMVKEGLARLENKLQQVHEPMHVQFQVLKEVQAANSAILGLRADVCQNHTTVTKSVDKMRDCMHSCIDGVYENVAQVKNGIDGVYDNVAQVKSGIDQVQSDMAAVQDSVQERTAEIKDIVHNVADALQRANVKMGVQVVKGFDELYAKNEEQTEVLVREGERIAEDAVKEVCDHTDCNANMDAELGPDNGRRGVVEAMREATAEIRKCAKLVHKRTKVLAPGESQAQQPRSRPAPKASGLDDGIISGGRRFQARLDAQSQGLPQQPSDRPSRPIFMPYPPSSYPPPGYLPPFSTSTSTSTSTSNLPSSILHPPAPTFSTPTPSATGSGTDMPFPFDNPWAKSGLKPDLQQQLESYQARLGLNEKLKNAKSIWNNLNPAVTTGNKRKRQQHTDAPGADERGSPRPRTAEPAMVAEHGDELDESSLAKIARDVTTRKEPKHATAPNKPSNFGEEN